MRLDELNMLSDDSAAMEFLRCCGSTRWARMMAAARPFGGVEAMVVAGAAIWSSLGAIDWLEAFRAHPAIGEEGPRGDAAVGNWSSEEQAGAALAPIAVRNRLAAANREYETRFGFIFIVCATGKGAGEMLAILEARLTNNADAELRIAAEEQRKITRLRLAKLFEDDQTAAFASSPECDV